MGPYKMKLSSSGHSLQMLEWCCFNDTNHLSPLETLAKSDTKFENLQNHTKMGHFGRLPFLPIFASFLWRCPILSANKVTKVGSVLESDFWTPHPPPPKVCKNILQFGLTLGPYKFKPIEGLG